MISFHLPEYPVRAVFFLKTKEKEKKKEKTCARVLIYSKTEQVLIYSSLPAKGITVANE